MCLCGSFYHLLLSSLSPYFTCWLSLLHLCGSFWENQNELCKEISFNVLCFRWYFFVYKYTHVSKSPKTESQTNIWQVSYVLGTGIWKKQLMKVDRKKLTDGRTESWILRVACVFRQKASLIYVRGWDKKCATNEGWSQEAPPTNLGASNQAR